MSKKLYCNKTCYVEGYYKGKKNAWKYKAGDVVEVLNFRYSDKRVKVGSLPTYGFYTYTVKGQLGTHHLPLYQFKNNFSLVE